jgi:poly-gamma-glutamate synthesis protein (capsule biosynthesis protein)
MKQKILIYGLVFLVLVVATGIVFTKPVKSNVKIASGQKVETASKKAVSLPKEPALENKNINFFFAGDAMLDRYIFSVAQKRGTGFLTGKMQSLFSDPNEIVFNLEGPVTKNSSVSKETLIGDKGNMRFTFDSDLTKNFLQSTRASAVFIGNNHVWDFGQAGFDDTKKFLTENQIPFFGDAGGENKPLERKIGNAKVAYVAFNQFLGQPAEKVVEEIWRLKKNNNFVVLYAHWGVEYARLESQKQKDWAHSFIDAGADLVIGSHPHVVQPIEVYKNKAIFYSLGNFVFDQYFSPETMEGLAVGVSVKDDGQEFYLSPLSLNHNGSTTLSEGKKKDSLLLWLAENSAVSGGLKEGLKSGHFQIENK